MNFMLLLLVELSFLVFHFLLVEVSCSMFVSLTDSVSLACLASNGNILVYSLPSLKPLLNVKYVNEFDVRISRTFDFGNHGHGIYMCTATELLKFTISADMW